MAQSAGPERDTLRKRIVRGVLSERRAILLDELRWIVLRREMRARGTRLRVIGASAMNSFARTVREHMSELYLDEIALGDGSRCPASLLAATAVYRIRDLKKLEAFLGAASRTVACRYVTDLPVHEFGESARYEHSRFAIAQYHLHLVDLFDGPIRVERVKIPPAHKVTIVSASPTWSMDDVLATATWQVLSLD